MIIVFALNTLQPSYGELTPPFPVAKGNIMIHCEQTSKMALRFTQLENLASVVLRWLRGRALRRDVALGHTTVDHKVRSIDEAALVTGKEKNCLCLLDSLAEATSGEVDFTAVPLRGIIAQPVLQERGARHVSFQCTHCRNHNLLERCRAQSIKAVPFPRMAHCEFPRQRQHRALARRIRKLRRRASHQRHNTRRVDHAPLLLTMLAEAQHRVLAAEPHALHVNSLGKIPDLLGGVDSVGVVSVHDTRVVENDVETAPGVYMLNHGLDVGFLGDICDFGLDLLGVWDDGLELFEGLVESGTGDVGEEDVGAFAGEEDAGFQADASGGALVGAR